MDGGVLEDVSRQRGLGVIGRSAESQEYCFLRFLVLSFLSEALKWMGGSCHVLKDRDLGL